MGNLTLGIIGAGHIGKKVEILGHALGMKVLVNDPPRERREGSSGFTSISRVLEESDILTLHVPLNKTGQDKSWHLLDRDALSLMKPGAWLINSARGEVVDGAGLIDVLRSRKSLNLILDVWENEPSINIELLCSASLATPHIAGYSWEGKANASAAIVRELSLAFDLPYKDWYPENIPDPAMKTCTIQCNDKPTEEIIFEAISHTYKIRNDDRNLRTFPENFASLRDGYSFRREFSAYQISHDNICTDAMKLLLRLGFFVNPAV